jgi:hypothetical protein
MKALMLIFCSASCLLTRENSAAQASGQTVRPVGVILAIVFDEATRRVSPPYESTNETLSIHATGSMQSVTKDTVASPVATVRADA